MTDPQIAILMLVLFIGIVLLGFPIAFTLIAMGLGFGYYAYAQPDQWEHIFGNRIFDLFVQNTFFVMSNDVLVAVPLVPVHGVCRRTREYRRPAVFEHPDRDPACSPGRWRLRHWRPARCSPRRPALSVRW